MTQTKKQGESWIKEGLKSEWRALKTPQIIFMAFAISGFGLLFANVFHINKNILAYTMFALAIILFILNYKKRGGTKTK